MFGPLPLSRFSIPTISLFLTSLSIFSLQLTCNGINHEHPQLRRLQNCWAVRARAVQRPFPIPSRWRYCRLWMRTTASVRDLREWRYSQYSSNSSRAIACTWRWYVYDGIPRPASRWKPPERSFHIQRARHQDRTGNLRRICEPSPSLG